jgi:hypothetical protein
MKSLFRPDRSLRKPAVNTKRARPEISWNLIQAMASKTENLSQVWKHFGFPFQPLVHRAMVHPVQMVVFWE